MSFRIANRGRAWHARGFPDAEQRKTTVAELGPVELLFVEFPGNQFSGEITPALQALVDAGTIRIIDLVFVAKDADGTAVGIEIEELDEASRGSFNALVSELEGLISEEDIADLAEELDPNSSAGIRSLRRDRPGHGMDFAAVSRCAGKTTPIVSKMLA